MHALGAGSPAGTHLPSLCSLSTDFETNAPSSEASFNQIQTGEDRFIGVANYREFLHDSRHLNINNTDNLTELRYRKTLESRMGLGGGGLMFFRASDPVNHSLQRDAEYAEGYSGCHDILNIVDDFAELNSQQVQIQKQQQQQQQEQEEQSQQEFGDLHSVGGPTTNTNINTTMNMMMTHDNIQDAFHTPPSSPMRGYRESPLIESNNIVEKKSTNSSFNYMMGIRSEVRDGFHTPLPHSRAMAAASQNGQSPAGTYGESNSTPGDNYWRTPMQTTGSFPTPKYSSRCNDNTNANAAGSSNYTATPNPGRPTSILLASSPQLRTPVKHENDLMSTPFQSVHHGSTVNVSLNGSPVPRRSALYSRHMTPRRRTETCHCVLNAEGLSLTDVKGRPNFNPLCWGHLGAVIALTNSVYLWQEQRGAVTLFLAPPPFGLVSAVSASRQPTDTEDVYTAIGLTTGITVIIKHHLSAAVSTRERRRFPEFDFSPDRSERAVFRDYASHVSTLQILGHQLYSGCMNGILTVRNLRDGSLLWQSSPFSQTIDKLSSYSRTPDCVVDVGAPIYKVEVTPDGEHIAIGTSDSLFVYHSSCMGPENRKKRRVVLANSNRPVRAFCWWGFPYNCLGNATMDVHSSNTINTNTTSTSTTTTNNNNSTATTSSSSNTTTNTNTSAGVSNTTTAGAAGGGGSIMNGSGRQCFLQNVLIYSGGVDGSILSVYSVGGRTDKATCRFAAPILAILSSETSEEILVSLDTPNMEESEGIHTINTNNTTIHTNNTNNNSINNIVGMEGVPLENADGIRLHISNNWNTYDLSSDDESPQEVLYVDQHLPVDIITHNSIHNQQSGGGNIAGNNRRFLHSTGMRFTLGTDTITTTTTTTTTPTTNINTTGITTGITMRPPLPRFVSSRGLNQENELLLVLRLKDGGETIERLNGFSGTPNASPYLALSPDNALLFSTGREMKMRLWRAFRRRRTESVMQCEMR